MVSAFLETLLPGSTSIALGHLAPLVPAFVVLGYLAIVLDRRRDGSPSQGDRQVGLKLVVFGLGLAGLAFAATGAFTLLAYVLSGFKGGTEPIKSSLANLISGGAVGNLIDRFARGYVIDFLRLRYWPVFNVADIVITLGLVLFAIGMRQPTQPTPSLPTSASA